MHPRSLSTTFSIIVALVLLVAAIAMQAHSQTLTTLWSFGFHEKGRGQDGWYPTGGLILDPQGNLYGTAEAGGSYNSGIVFEVSPSGQQTETILYSFRAGKGGPLAGLIRDQGGDLFGTTCGYDYVCYGEGTVFKLSPSGNETVLHIFSYHPRKKDAYTPAASLIFDAQGNLYGTAEYGGNYNCVVEEDSGCGAVFEVTQSGKETLLYSFNGGSDGAEPIAPVIFDAEGNLYGTTREGGVQNPDCTGYTYGCGVVFKLAPSGAETVLYSFCQLSSCADGALPQGGLIFDAQGNLYGTATTGGTNDFGVIFKLDPSGTETVLFNFTGGADGGYPVTGLTFDSKGNLYGTTQLGGAYGYGAIFELTPSGTETVLYSFAGGANGGTNPTGPLVFDSQGNLYGTTTYGGAYGKGTVFMLTP